MACGTGPGGAVPQAVARMGLVVGGGGDEGLGVGEVVVGVAGLVGGGVVGQENGDGVVAGREGVLAAAVGVVGGSDRGVDVGSGVGLLRWWGWA